MSNYIVDLFPIALLVIAFIGFKPAPLTDGINADYLSKETSTCYKGFFAIVILLLHMQTGVPSGFLIHNFDLVGYLAVSVFFFFSGYGLQKSYISKGDEYSNGFLKRRILPVLLPYLSLVIPYFIMYTICGDNYSLSDYISFIDGGTIVVMYSWFVIVIIVYYLLFWALMRICKKDYIFMIVLCFIAYITYEFYAMMIMFDRCWYTSVQLTIVGMAWAVYEDKILGFIKNHKIIIPIIWCAFLVLFYMQNYSQLIHNIWGADRSLMILTSILFTFCVLSVSMRFHTGNKILYFLGNLSLEIYLIQGLFMYFLRRNLVYITNDFIFCAVVIFLTIVTSYFMNKGMKKICVRYS